MHDEDAEDGRKTTGGLDRRTFLKASGIPLAAPVVLGPRLVRAADAEVAVYGPGKVQVTLDVNGQSRTVNVEPRVTLLDALRNELDLTGAKRVCDRGTCGACTVLMDGKPVYACSVLAIEAQRQAITTVEALGAGRNAAPRAAGLRRQRRPAVRLLHAGLRRRLQGLPRPEPQSHARRRCGRASAATSAAAAPTSGIRARGGAGRARPRRGGARRWLSTPGPRPRSAPSSASGSRAWTARRRSPGTREVHLRPQPSRACSTAKIVRSPHAHAKVVSVDTSAAESMPGVKAVQVVQGPGTEIFWAGGRGRRAGGGGRADRRGRRAGRQGRVRSASAPRATTTT